MAEALTADGEAKASLFSVVARESTDTVAVALRMSLEDTFSELGACSGRAMNRLSQHFSRRLLKTDRRGSAGVFYVSNIIALLIKGSSFAHSLRMHMAC